MNNYPVSCQRSATPEYFPRFIGGASVLFTAGVVLKKMPEQGASLPLVSGLYMKIGFFKKRMKELSRPFLVLFLKIILK
ncbi:MAG: hypothetical protein RR837_10950 [Bacteroidales bacterium]